VLTIPPLAPSGDPGDASVADICLSLKQMFGIRRSCSRPNITSWRLAPAAFGRACRLIDMVLKEKWVTIWRRLREALRMWWEGCD
jgi:hypothetical protein